MLTLATPLAPVDKQKIVLYPFADMYSLPLSKLIKAHSAYRRPAPEHGSDASTRDLIPKTRMPGLIPRPCIYCMSSTLLGDLYCGVSFPEYDP